MASSEVTLKDPGLVENGPDGMSCLHACIQMAQRTCSGREVYSFERIDQILRRQPGKYSWEYAILSELAETGFDVETFGCFDLNKFVARPNAYLLEFFGPEVGSDQIEHSDIDQVVKDAEHFLAATQVTCHVRFPTVDDVIAAINNGGYVLAAINQRVLQNDPGIAAHLLFVYGHSSRGIRFHNPGPPPTAASEIPWDLFEKCWNRPEPENREMYVIRPCY